MAKKKAKKGHKKSRRRIGALSLNPASPLVKFAPIALGFGAGDMINDQIDKIVPDSVDQKIVAGVQVVAGFFLAFKMGKKSVLKSVVGGALLGAGAKRAAKEFGILSGFQNVPVLGNFQNVPVLGTYNVPSPMLNGVGGYDVPTPMSSVMGSVDADNGGGNLFYRD
jgi:hypothetical protein